jgi:Co/Zn/Cd efflux system component
MSYGWVRSEILGGLTNGCFLLSLCLYVALESIPRFIDPPEFDSGWPFIIVAACGLAINTFGTIIFACTPPRC